MVFYDDISKYYDLIFPVSQDTISFLAECIGPPKKSILDVACGTGDYSIALDKLGFDLTAVDIDKEMIGALRGKLIKKESGVKCLQADMQDLHTKFDKGSFDAVYCIGNSLVHLDSLDKIESFFKDVHSLLTKGGTFIFQIINFDRIISKDIKALPTIVDDSVPLKFERFYSYKNSKITFKTILSVEDRTIENEINLTPLLYDKAVSMLMNAGFKELHAYGDFKKNDYDKEKSFLLIIEAR
jgi:SAM-dependent methyltransferase